MAKYELGSLVWRVTGDTKDFDKSITSAESKLGKLSKAATRIGGSLTKFVTLPLVGIGGAATKAASDLEESLNAINVVFGDASGQIEQFGETAAESVGLSQTAFNGLATVIGSQLKQSGLSIDEVADQTNDLTIRAADLASVFNVEVSDSLGALGAALRGETEPARRFGINISEAALQAEALSSGLVQSKDQITEQIKVQARYNLIMEQSEQVAGDFENTSDSLANQTRILKADIVNIGAELGQAFIPVVTDAVSSVRDAVEWFGDLDNGTKELITRMGILAAASGPVIGTVGVLLKLKKAIIAINTAALFGPLGIIAGLAAVTTGLIAVGRARREANLEEVAAEFADIQSTAGLAVEEIDAIEKALSRGVGGGLENANMQVTELAENLGVSKTAVIDIGLNSDTVTSAYKEQLQALRDQVTEQAVINSYQDSWIAQAAEQEAADARGEEILRQRAEDAEREAAERERMNALAITARAEAERKYEILLQEEEAQTRIQEIELERQIALSDLADNYVRTGEAVDLLNEYYDTLIENEEESADQAGEWAGAWGTSMDERIAQTEAGLAYIRGLEDEEEEALKDKIGRLLQEWTGYFSTLGNLVSTGLGLRVQALQNEADAVRNSADQQLGALEERYERELELAGVAEETAVEAAQRKLEEARLANDEEAISEAEKALKKAKIDAEYNKQRTELEKETALQLWEIEKEQFEAQKQIDMIQAAVTTAQMAANAYNALVGIPVVGPALAVGAAAAATAFGIKQQQLIANQPAPPKPEFALGGEFITDGRQEIVVGDNPGGRERVSVEPLSSPNVNGPDGNMMQIQIMLDGKTLAKTTAEYINNGKVRLEVAR